MVHAIFLRRLGGERSQGPENQVKGHERFLIKSRVLLRSPMKTHVHGYLHMQPHPYTHILLTLLSTGLYLPTDHSHMIFTLPDSRTSACKQTHTDTISQFREHLHSLEKRREGARLT